SARSGQYRDTEHAGPAQTQAEEPVRAVTGQRTQRLGGIARGGDGRFAVSVQRGGRRENDEVHHQVRKEHAGEDVVPGTSQFPIACAFTLFNGRLAQSDVLLYFLRGLPKEEVWRDGSSQDADQRGPIRGGPLRSEERRVGKEC